MFKLLFKANKKHILQALPFNIEMETGFSSYRAFAKSCNTACHLIYKWGETNPDSVYVCGAFL